MQTQKRHCGPHLDIETVDKPEATVNLSSSRHTCRWVAAERMRQQQDRDSARPPSSRARVGRISDNSAAQQLEADALQHSFPHGAPKGVLLRSRERQVHAVPAVGFGFVCTAPIRDVRTLR